MIKKTKANPPAVLVDNEAHWTQAYLNARASGNPVPDSIRYRYRDPAIKAALVAEAHGKCVYCEQKENPGETDHVVPVDEKPEMLVVWTNLAFACKLCNTHKGKYFSEAEPLINPFVNDPAEYLWFFGPLIMEKVGNGMGLRTILQLKLRRPDLMEKRKERIEKLQPLIEQWSAQPEGETKNLLRREILREANEDKEFSAVVKAYLYHALEWKV